MLNDKVKDIWNSNAEFWDSRMGEGNAFHKTLIEPAQLKLLNIKPGDKILDIACGNGQFARKMAGLGAEVTGFDFAENFIAIAKSKGDWNIQYQVIDATQKIDLEKLTGLTFDSIVCTMAIMDMENIEVLIKHLPGLLKKDGVFVFSILHPCFNSGENALVHEKTDTGGEVKSRYFAKISNYLIEKSSLGVGMVGTAQTAILFPPAGLSHFKIFFREWICFGWL